jgi:hypothetical protein
MSYIKVECKNCKKHHQFNASDFDFESVDSDERQMGAEITYEGIIERDCACGQNIEVTHRFWEYPEGVENHKETECAGAEIIENKL